MSSTSASGHPLPVTHTAKHVTALLAVVTGVLVTIEFAAIGLLPQLAEDLGVSIQRAGDLVSVFALGAAVFGPLLTLFVAHFPAHRVLALCVLISGVGNIVTGVWPSYGVMLSVRALQGVVLAPFIGVASTLLSSLVTSAEAGRAIGQMNIGTVVGTVFVVPVVVALADRFGWRPVTIAIGTVALLLALVVSRKLNGLPLVRTAPWRQQLTILQQFRFLGHLAVSVLLFASMFVSYSYIAALLEGPFALSRTGVAIAMFAFGVAGIAGNHLASSYVGVYPLGLTNLIAVLLVIIGTALTAFIDYRLVALVLLLPWGAVHTAAFVACQVRVMFAATEAPAFASSLNIAACNLGIAIGAFSGGWVAGQFGVASVGLAAGVIGMGSLAIGVVLVSPLGHRAQVCEMK